MNHSFAIKLTAIFSFVLTSLSFNASAQNITGDEIKTQFVNDWERAKAYTLDYLNTMPADKYSFKAVDSIRSFAQQMLHLASGNVGLIMFASGQKIDWPGRGLENSPTAQNKDSVVYYVTKAMILPSQALEGFDPAKFGEFAGPGKDKVTRFALFLKAFEHQTHHRGQTTIYIRLLGIRPPNERLF